MASAAEQMAANMSWGAFGKAKELRQRLLFTIGLLIIYRLGTYIPVPGIDADQLRQFVEQAQQGQAHGGLLDEELRRPQWDPRARCSFGRHRRRRRRRGYCARRSARRFLLLC